MLDRLAPNPVATENPIPSENTEVLFIREIMVATMSSLFALLALQFSNPCCPAGGDPRASSTCGLPKERAASLAPPPLRPILVGCVVPILVRLAATSRDGSARHGPPLAPPNFPCPSGLPLESHERSPRRE